MRRYDSMTDPDGQKWLALDEGERLELVMAHHRRERVELERPEAQATFHVIVENQVARGDELPARRVLARLQREGLDRHEAVHAIGSVLAQHFVEVLSEPEAQADHGAAYWAAVESLNADEWRRSFESSEG